MNRSRGMLQPLKKEGPQNRKKAALLWLNIEHLVNPLHVCVGLCWAAAPQQKLNKERNVTSKQPMQLWWNWAATTGFRLNEAQRRGRHFSPLKFSSTETGAATATLSSALSIKKEVEEEKCHRKRKGKTPGLFFLSHPIITVWVQEPLNIYFFHHGICNEYTLIDEQACEGRFSRLFYVPFHICLTKQMFHHWGGYDTQGAINHWVLNKSGHKDMLTHGRLQLSNGRTKPQSICAMQYKETSPFFYIYIRAGNLGIMKCSWGGQFYNYQSVKNFNF